jgi:hypothetical protein
MTKSMSKIKISKLDAARRQLDTAIGLWFRDDDPVSIHTLAAASHQIIHDICEKHGVPDLLLNGGSIKPERRQQIIRSLKEPMTFFKHANRDPHNVIDFNPDVSDGFMIFSVMGLISIGETPSDLQRALLWWHAFRRPEILNEDGRQAVAMVPVETKAVMLKLDKKEFLKDMLAKLATLRTQ